jgi:4-hydroxybenzoate polyprenyltransferase
VSAEVPDLSAVGSTMRSRRGAVGRAAALVTMARPYSLLWFVILPVTTMALWLRDGNVEVTRLLVVLAACVAGDAAFTTLNDVMDRESDRLSVEPQRNTRPLATGVISPRWAYTQVGVLVTCCLAASYAASLKLGLFMSSGMISGASYSAGPVRFVARPLLSQVFWVLLWPSMYVTVYLGVGGDFDRGLPYLVGTVLFMGIGETLAKDLRDLDNDAAAGKRTTPVAYGPRSTATASVAFFVLGSAAYVLAPLLTSPSQVRVALALAVVLGLWCGRAYLVMRILRRTYSKDAARTLHVGSIRVFLVVNLILIAGIGE